MVEDIYFWTKNGRPDIEKDRDHNASLYILSNMKTGGVIMKTYHLDPKDPIWNKTFHEKMDRTLFSHDLAPFVKYSLNKKRRWEASGDVETLNQLQDTYRDMDVYVTERVWLKGCPYFCFVSRLNYYHNYFLEFPIRHIHELKLDGYYQCLSSNSVYGQPTKSLLPENRSPRKTKNLKIAGNPDSFSTPKVAYHIITPPKIYEKLRNKDFHPGGSDRWLKHRSIIHWRRCKIMTESLLSLRYEDFEDLGEKVDMTDDYSIYDRYAPPSELTKNSRPDTEKNHDRNSSCKYIMSYLKTEGVLIKTYHLGESNIWSWNVREEMDRTFFHQDLASFVNYSINKMKRWQVQGGVDLLDELRGMYDGMEVVIIERVWMRGSPYHRYVVIEEWFQTYFNYLPIRRIHQVLPDNSYQCISTKSVYGQPLKHFLPENRSSEKPKTKGFEKSESDSKPIIAYHIITPPKNYETLLNAEFCPGKDRKGHRTNAHSRRFLAMKNICFELRHKELLGLEEKIDVTEESIGNLIDYYPVYNYEGVPRKYYNLEDHLVERFVFLKRRK